MKNIFLACTLAFAASAWAQSPVQVQDAWARATVANQSATGAFMKLTAPVATRLVEVRSTAAGIIEIHEMKLDGDVMRMRALDTLPLPAGQPVELKPGGLHVMLMDLKAQVKPGDAVPLTLVFEGADGKRFTQDVKATARALGAQAPAPAGGHGSGHGAGHKH